jgi:hypothetical protein
MTRTLARYTSLSLVVAAALAGSMCNSKSGGSNPAAPSDTTTTSAPTLTPTTASVQITINPNPVPFSGSPITDTPQCAGYENTWFYDQVLTEFNGTETKFTSRIDYFDGKVANNIQGLNIVVPARGTQALKTRWCSGARTAHQAQTQLTGTDANGNAVTVIGQVANLMAPAK